jgi:hypothetical protein
MKEGAGCGRRSVYTVKIVGDAKQKAAIAENIRKM